MHRGKDHSAYRQDPDVALLCYKITRLAGLQPSRHLEGTRVVQAECGGDDDVPENPVLVASTEVVI